MRAVAVFLTMLLGLALLAPGPSARAQLPVRGENAMSVSLVAGRAAPGEPVDLAFVMRPDPGWHGYWENPGDAGTGARVEWDLPAGMTAAPLRYPVPDRLTIAGLMNYVFERDYALLTQVRVPAGAAAGTAFPVRATVHYLVCTDEICVPESASVATTIRVGAGADAQDQIDSWRRALPRPLPGEGRFEVAEGRLRVAIPLPSTTEVTDPYLYPVTPEALAYSAPQSVSRAGDLLIVETEAAAGAASLSAIDAVLEYADGKGVSLTARPGDVPAAGVPLVSAPEDAAAPAASILAALAGAFLGGLLLNIMPCVFPILSLKALSLAKAGADERAAKREALAYSAGAVLVCLALGALLLALRASGEMVGWAFQLQDPRVILFLLLLVTAIALNLAGLFELPSLGFGARFASGDGASGAFWTGALAAFVATPCTGPFMGLALGAALILPAAAALAVFAGLGLGLAFPFLLLGFVPALRRRLPRPGPWMARFRSILAIPMLLTAFGLVWILGGQTGVDGMALGLGAALILGLSLWWAGKGRAWLALMPAAAAGLAAILLIPTIDAPAATRNAGPLPSEPFSEERLAALRQEGRPVFVYFTADWCLTCKVNEAGVLGREEVARSFQEKDMAVLVGDWTSGDAAIGHFLEKHGRSGIPLYLHYAPGEPPEVLPQILTVGRLTRL